MKRYKSKKYINFSLIAILGFSLIFSIQVNAVDNYDYLVESEKSEGIEAYLIDKGCDSGTVEKLPDRVNSSTYQRIKNDFNGEVTVSVDINTISIPVEESTQYADIKTQLNVTSYLENFADYSTGQIVWCDVYITYDWMETPEVMERDAITIKWDPQYFSFVTEYGFNANSYVQNAESEELEYIVFDSMPDISNNGSIGWYVELQKPDLDIEKQINPGGFMMVGFEPSYEFYPADNIVTTFEVLYIHNNDKNTEITLVTDNDAISASGSNISTLKKTLRYRSNIINN